MTKSSSGGMLVFTHYAHDCVAVRMTTLVWGVSQTAPSGIPPGCIAITAPATAGVAQPPA